MIEVQSKSAWVGLQKRGGAEGRKEEVTLADGDSHFIYMTLKNTTFLHRFDYDLTTEIGI